MAELPQPLLALITDDALPIAHVVDVVRAACDHGCPSVQLRDRRLGAGALLELARTLAETTRRAGARLVVNDRIDVALAAGADGVHLPGGGMASERARALVGPDRLLGRSVHTFAEIAREAELGAVDYLQFGPVYATASKLRYGPPQGENALEEAVRAAGDIAVVAVGGIDATRVRHVVRRGARGVAVIGAVMLAPDPGAAVRRLLGALRRE